MLQAIDFQQMSHRELAKHLRLGHPIDPAMLDNTEYLGVSLGLPELAIKLTWLKFKKVFCRDEEAGTLRGWNVKLEQNGLNAPHEAKRKRDGQPQTFGHYGVVPATSYRVPGGARQGLMLDYGLGGNLLWDPTGRMRDPLVAVHKGSVEFLLGWTYVDLGLIGLPTPSFFTLQRDCPLSHRAHPPRKNH